MSACVPVLCVCVCVCLFVYILCLFIFFVLHECGIIAKSERRIEQNTTPSNLFPNFQIQDNIDTLGDEITRLNDTQMVRKNRR